MESPCRTLTVLVAACLTAAASFASASFTLQELQDPKILIDGRVDEPTWRSVLVQSGFVVVHPDTADTPDELTEVRVFYSERGLYVAAQMHQPVATLMERLSARDNHGLQRDSFEIAIDPSGSGRYGYWFQVALGGSVSDGTLVPTARYSPNWDGVWQGAAARTETGWSAEIFVPWSTLNMPSASGPRRMGIYTARKVGHLGERWAWPGLPFSRPSFMRGFEAFTVNNVQPGKQWHVVPYTSTTLDGVEDAFEVRSGAEVFYRPLPNLQAAATVNPDFGTVEADGVIVNLSAFETFFPEKRLFFVEGQDVFNAHPRATSRQPVTLLHTRRIGAPARRPLLADDEALVDGDMLDGADLLGAGKVTGEFGRTRFGVLGAMEDESQWLIEGTGGEYELTTAGRRFSAVRLVHEQDDAWGQRSLGLMSTSVLHEQGDAYVHAVDAHSLSADGRWKTSSQIMTSQLADTEGYGGIFDVRYSPQHGQFHNFSVDAFDAELDINDLGFLVRNDLRSARYKGVWIDSDVPGLRERRTRLQLNTGWNTAGERVANGVQMGRDYIFPNRVLTRINLGVSPQRFDDRNMRGFGSYRVQESVGAHVHFETDPSRQMQWKAGAQWREQGIDGVFRRYNAALVWRPSHRFSTAAQLTYVDHEGWLLHQGDEEVAGFSAEQWMPSLNVDYFLTARQHLRFAVQWVGLNADEEQAYTLDTQARQLVEQTAGDGLYGSNTTRDFTVSRLNMQLRYRFELAPLSDLFIVYTRNGRALDQPGQSFDQLLDSALNRTIAEQLTIKFRYRLGSS